MFDVFDNGSEIQTNLIETVKKKKKNKLYDKLKLIKDEITVMLNKNYESNLLC